MCSDCGEEEPEGEEPEVDTEAPRTLRGRTKLRKPGKYRFSTDSRDGEIPKSKSAPYPTTHQNVCVSKSVIQISNYINIFNEIIN